MTKDEILEKLKELVKSGVSKTQLEKDLGYLKNGLSVILSGKKKLSDKWVYRLSEGLNRPPYTVKNYVPYRWSADGFVEIHGYNVVNLLASITVQGDYQLGETVVSDGEKYRVVSTSVINGVQSNICYQIRPKFCKIVPTDAPDYKECGLYRFENGGFVEEIRNPVNFPDFTKAIEARFGENKTLPEGKIEFKPETLKSYKKGNRYNFGMLGVNEDGSPQSIVEATPELNQYLTEHFIGNDALLKQIKEIEAEEIPKERNTPVGKKVWAKEQQKRIQDLKNQLK